MSVVSADLGEIKNLATALGLVDAGGDFRGDWLSRPGDYLSSVLADEDQRDALVAFVDEALGGEAREQDPDGLVWLPIVSSENNPHATFYVVLDDRPANYVAVGIGARLTTTVPSSSRTSIHVPIFRAAKAGKTVSDAIVIGTAAAVIRLETEITVSSGPPLGAIGLVMRVPTAAGAAPELGLSLKQLQLPGSAQPRDLSISLSNLDELDDTALELVLGVVRAQADAIGTGPVVSLVGLLGLKPGTGVPALPLDALTTEGPRAIATWFESVMASTSARAAWLSHLSGLLGGTVTGNEVTLTVGAAQVTIGIGVAIGPGGQVVVTPRVGVSAGSGASVRFRAEAEILRLDLATRSAHALPNLELAAQFGKRLDGGVRILTGDPQVDGVRVGFKLDGSRRPTFVLAADGVTIAGHSYPTLDLTSPDAIAEVGAAAFDAIVDELIAQLGPIATAIRSLIGLTPPTGAPGATTLNIAQFLQDPLAAIRAFWRALLTDHPTAVPELLTLLRDLIADGSQAAAAIEGTGTEADPWRVPIIAPVELLAWRSTGGDVIELALSAVYAADTLGQRCTRIESRLIVSIARLDLAAGSATFLSSIDARLTGRARGRPQALFQVGPFTITADHIGLGAKWRPESGVSIDPLAPNLTIRVDTIALPLSLPTVAADGTFALSADGWDALEPLVGMVASNVPLPWVADLMLALGWSPEARERDRPRLRLADLAVDPVAAIKSWLTALALNDAGLIADALEAVARVITGSMRSWGRFDGSGTRDDPYRVPILPIDSAPALAAWLVPEGPKRPFTTAPDPIRAWRPGMSGLSHFALADALYAETPSFGDIAPLVSGRTEIANGLALLIARWTGTDGRIVPPATVPAGITLDLHENVTGARLALTVDVATLFASAPATVVRIAVVPAGEALPWSDVPVGRLIDLRAAGLAPEAFVQPAAASGEWFIALARRLDARLASGDSDGVAGQTARLVRVLSPFSTIGGTVALVAQDAAGHAALNAANALSFVTGVATLGTAFGPVAFTILDEQPAADTLRLLKWLAPPVTDDETDDADLLTGRELIGALTTLLPLDDPGRDIRPPAAPVAAPRAGLEVHALFGVLDEPTVARALTAIVAAGLSERAVARADAGRVNTTGIRLGLWIPVAPGTEGLTVSGHGLLELAGADLAGAGVAVSVARSVSLHLEIREVNGWLAGGPDPERGPGPRAAEEVRWLEANVAVPLGGGEARAELVLHEPRVFGIERERWVVRPEGVVAATAGVVTPALPEIRVLLSLVAERITAAAPTLPSIGALANLLRGLGLLGVPGGTVPDAIDHFIHEPAVHIAGALNDGARRAEISAAINQLLSALPSIAVDLGTGTLVFNASGTPGEFGLLPWNAHVDVTGAGQVGASLSFGSSGTTAAGGALVRFDTGPLRAVIEVHRPGAASPDLIPLWPSPDAQKLGRLIARLVPAESARMLLEYVRELDESARPVIDAALDVIGLLTTADADGKRSVPLPLQLFADPIGWLQHPTSFGGPAGFNATKVAAFLDALKPIVGVAGAPGEWALASGVKLIADSVDGHLRLGLGVDTSGFSPIATAPGRLVASGTFSLSFPPNVAPRPAVTLAVGLSGAAPGRRALHVSLNGGVRAWLRPDTGADLPLYPDPPGLGNLAQTAITQALPFVLDHLAAETGADLAGDVGAVVRAVGDALALRTGAPLKFDGARIQAWASDPAASLAAALPTLTVTALQAIADALQPMLLPGDTATVVGGALRVEIRELTLAWRPSPFLVTFGGTVTGIPSVERMELAMELDTSGLQGLSARLGPAGIDAGGVTLRPFLAAVVGESPAGGRRIELGLALDDAGTDAVLARWLIDGAGLQLVAKDGSTEHTDAEHVALALIEAVLDLVASFVVETTTVQQLLGRPVGSSTVREVLRGVLLEDVPTPTDLDDELFDPDRLLPRLQKLAVNMAAANPSVDVGGLSVALGKSGQIIQLTLGVNGRVPLSQGDVIISMEADSRWIKTHPAAGLSVGVLRVVGDTITFAPGLAVNGIGLRIAKSSGPLLDLGVTLGSLGIHVFGAIQSGSAPSGGIHLQLSDLAIGVAGAQGGNPVARGIMADSGKGSNKLAPSFSPALAVQKHGGGPVVVSLSAGEGAGPWWVAIQKGFGPLYIEQVGFGVSVDQEQLKGISLLLDGRVSFFGLTAAVDDLQLTYVVASNASVFDASRWAVDLAGLGVAADMAGLTLTGGLRKFGDGENVEYVGMLLARFAVYGVSVYGGYGSAVVGGERFAAFFAFGAINGPIGGPPAFFLTGIGGGLGINRGLVFPDDLSKFGEFPFLKALDPAASPSPDPMAEIVKLRDYFPMRRGEFWFAAGISFTSFALVDGIAVVAVAVGDGLEIALLGLARMALPRPEVALVSIELGLIARFSTKEGVLWIQGQLTDNCWLLNESMRLTGGFAFVSWFAGPHKGEFVLTMGGLHPDFRRDGYPKVPRLGARWGVSDRIVVKGGIYYALTSEAAMAGGKLEASADFGAAWAHVVFEANGIVYFDPFRFEVEVYARITAGVTIDVWIGEITISISIGARIMVAGPKFHGRATFDVGPIELTVSFGPSNQTAKTYLTWPDFVRKYLEEASPGIARTVSAMPGKGSLPPGTGPGGPTDTGTADGSSAKPFTVLSEFEITVTSTVPSSTLSIAGVDSSHTPSLALGVAPMAIANANSRLELHLFDSASSDRLGALIKDVRNTGTFPVGVWGKPQPDDDKKIPSGDIITAVEGVRFEAVASIQGTLPGEIRYRQVEVGPRKPLPFVHAVQFRALFMSRAGELSALLPVVSGGAATFAEAKPWLAHGGHGRTALAALERERSAAPRLGSLTQELAEHEMAVPAIGFPERPPTQPVNVRVAPPRAIAILSASVMPERAAARTSVTDAAGARRTAAPTMDAVRARFPLAVAAKLVRVPATAGPAERTVAATGAVPLTRPARGAVAAVAARGSFTEAHMRLAAMTGGLKGGPEDARSSTVLRAGEVAVLQLPNAARDMDDRSRRPRLAVRGGDSRVVAIAHGGDVLWDGAGSREGMSLPVGTERVAVLSRGKPRAAAPGLSGWHSGQELAYVGWSSALVPGGVMRAEGATVPVTRQRFRAGWIRGAELVAGTTIVSTRFTESVTSVAIVLDDPVGLDGARGLSLTLDGADRAVGADGQPQAPTIVTAGNRSVLIYAIVPEYRDAARPGPVTVSIASQANWHVVGVLAGRVSVDSIADRVVQHGLDAVLQPLVSEGAGTVEIDWIEQGAPFGTPQTGGLKPAPTTAGDATTEADATIEVGAGFSPPVFEGASPAAKASRPKVRTTTRKKKTSVKAKTKTTRAKRSAPRNRKRKR